MWLDSVTRKEIIKVSVAIVSDAIKILLQITAADHPTSVFFCGSKAKGHYNLSRDAYLLQEPSELLFDSISILVGFRVRADLFFLETLVSIVSRVVLMVVLLHVNSKICARFTATMVKAENLFLCATFNGHPQFIVLRSYCSKMLRYTPLKTLSQ